MSEPKSEREALLHGASGSWRHWTRNIEPLSRTRSVWAADLPGIGDSDAPDETPPRLEVARIVLDGIEELIARLRGAA